MINLTPLFRSHFLSRLQQQVRYIDHADAVQQGTNSAEGSDAAAINTANQQGDNLGGHAQKNLSGDTAKWFALVDEKDRQISRLLSLLEKEQESKSELERKNDKLVDALINQKQ